MPSVVISAVASHFITGALTPILGSLLARAIGGLVSLAISSAFSSKPKSSSSDIPSFTSSERDRTQVIRSSVRERHYTYGQRIVSGPLVFAASTGAGNKYLHLVIPLASTELYEIGELYFNDVRVDPARIDSTGMVVTGRFDGLIRIKKHLGKENQVADSDLVSEVTDWTTNHRLRGIAYIYVRLEYSQDKFPSGIPNIRAVIKGKKVWDPRDTAINILTSEYVSGGLVRLVTDSEHGFADGDKVFITGHTSGTEIFGEFEIQILNPTDGTEFYIELDMPTSTGGGTGGTVTAMRFTNNAALCQLDYLTSKDGLDISETEFTAANFLAAANSCEEQVELRDDTGDTVIVKGTSTFSVASVAITIDKANIGTNATVPTDLRPLPSPQPPTGTALVYSNTSADDIDPLVDASTYYYVQPDDAFGVQLNYYDRFGLTLTQAEAQAAVPVDDDYDSDGLIEYAENEEGYTGTHSLDGFNPTFTRGTAETEDMATADPIKLSSTDTLPAPLVAGTTYYYIRLSSTTFQVASSEANANNGVFINVTDAGTGTHSVIPVSTENQFERSSTDIDIDNGTIVNFTTTNTLPAGLVVGTDYYYIRIDRTLFKLATTLQNSLEDTEIEITDPGAGTHTMTVISHLRYTMDGVVELRDKPIDIVQDMTACYAGALVYSQGKYFIYPGVSQASAMALTDDNLSGDIQMETGPARREIYNAVRGTYTNPDNFWQATEFPPVTNRLYELQDSSDNPRTIFRDIEFAFISNSIRAQRVAKIELERSRQGIVVQYPCNLSVLQLRPGDIVQVTNAILGWTNKEFIVLSWEFEARNRALGILLTMQEWSSGIYDWAKGDETRFDLAPNTTLPPIATAQPPTNLALYSGTGQLFVANDGTVVTRILCLWTAADDAFVTQYELQARNITTGEDYQTVVVLDAAVTSYYIAPADDSELYDVRLRSINIRGVRSDWEEVQNHLVIGKTEPPEDVVDFNALQNGSVVVFSWTQVSDVDLAGYEIRYVPQGLSLGWSDGTALTEVTRGTQITTAAVPPGSWTFMIKAVDTTGNYSVTEDTSNATVSNTQDIVLQTTYSPDWFNRLYGLSCNGAGENNASIPYVAAQALAVSSDFSIEFWLKVTNLGDETKKRSLLRRSTNIESTTSTQFRIFLDEEDASAAGTYLTVQFSSYSKIIGIPIHIFLGVEDSTEIVANKDYHFAVTYDSGSSVLYLYRDAVLIGSQILLIPPITQVEAPIEFGGRPSEDSSSDWDDNHEFIIDELRLWSKQLTVTEIAASKDKILVGNETGLIGYYDFDEGAGNFADKTSTSDGTVSTAEFVPVTTPDHYLIHDVSGRLLPASNSLAADLGYDVFDNFCDGNFDTMIFDGTEIDVGLSGSVRLWANITSYIGPGESGTSNPKFWADYKAEGDEYDGWEQWSIGTVSARYIRPRIRNNNNNSLVSIGELDVVADAQERTETGNSVTVAAGGTTITFDTAFYATPSIVVTAEGSTALIATYESPTSTGFIAHVYNSDGTDIGGTVSWRATGA